MTTYTYGGLKTTQDRTTGRFTSVSIAKVTLTLPEHVTDLSYTIIEEQSGWVPVANVSLSNALLTLDGEAIDLSSPDLVAELGAVGWGAGNLSYVLLLSTDSLGTKYIAELGGDELPFAGTAADLNDFVANQIHSVGPAGVGSGFGPGESISLGSIPYSWSQEGSLIVDTDESNILTGGAGDDAILGSGGDDTISGGDGNDTLIGGAGNDNLDGGASAGRGDAVRYDFETGGSGVSVDLTKGTATDTFGDTDSLSNIQVVHGTDQADQIIGDTEDNGLYGHGGNDSIDGGSGSDFIDGGDGNDRIAAGDLDDEIYGGSGDDTIDAGAGDDYIEGNDGNDSISAGAGMDRIDGGAGNDRLDGAAGFDVLIGGSGDDRLDGGADIDAAIYSDSIGDVRVDLNTGTASDGMGGTDTLISIEIVKGSHTAKNTLIGDTHNNFLEGGGADDALSGGGGNDVLTGMGGNDYFAPGIGNDAVVGGTGFDVVSYADSTVGVMINLDAGISSVYDLSSWGSSGVFFVDSLSSIEGARGSSYDDMINGNSDNNSLLGMAGDDSISGGAGNDWLQGGAGADKLNGGDGTDTAVYRSSSEGVSVSLADGNGSGGDAQGDTLSGIEKLVGSDYGDTLTGDGGNNALNGLAGDDVLSGGAGRDWIVGGAGGDSLDGGAGSDWLLGGTGNDTLTGGDGIDHFVFIQSADPTQSDAGSHDVVTDFSASVDLIRFEGTGLSFGDLAISQVGANAEIAWGNGNTIMLQGIDIASLDSDDFSFL